VSERADPKAWTCEVRTRDGRLPDVAALAQGILDMGLGARLRGVEATLDGTAVERDGTLWVESAGTGEVVRLAPLRRKVQWDVARKRLQRPTRAERLAYDRLRRELRAESRPIRVIGTLVPSADGGPVTLEVREFSWEASLLSRAQECNVR
jgi:hypothetical protein